MNRKKYISTFTVISAALALVAFIIIKICERSTDFSDTLNGSVGMILRRGFSFISSKIPFSVFEILVCLIPIAVIILIIISIKVFKRGEGRIRYIFNLLGIVFTVYTFYIFTFGISYHITPLAKRIDLETIKVNADNLVRTSQILIDEINTLAEKLDFQNGESKMGYDTDTLSKKLSEAYDKVAEEYKLFPSFDSRVKPIKASGVMSSLRLLGMYTFYTGESNINVAYPDFDRPYTTAHEFAHQRGIARENEANFIAFIVCINSDDDYIKYSGYLRLYEYIRSALYKTDREKFTQVDKALSDKARSDIRASNAVSQKYGNTFLGELSDAINDLYLKQNGTEGVVSYGLVTRLAVSYYENGQGASNSAQ